MGKFNLYRLRPAVIAADGSATVYTPNINGKIVAVKVYYPTNTCTVDLDSDEGVSQKIINLAAANTDAVYYPRTPVCNNAGNESVTYDGTNKVHDEFIVYGRVLLTIASGTAGEAVKVDIIVEEF